MFRLPKMYPYVKSSTYKMIRLNPRVNLNLCYHLRLRIQLFTNPAIKNYSSLIRKMDHIQRSPWLKIGQQSISSRPSKNVLCIQFKEEHICNTTRFNIHQQSTVNDVSWRQAKLVSNSIMSGFKVRDFTTSSSAQTQCWPRPDYGPVEVRRTALLNGITVAAAKPMGAIIAACTIMFQAGSRFECDDTLGATHFIRACSSASGCGYSSFSKMRVLQQNGVSVTCSTDRQTVCFTMRCPLSTFSNMKYYLQDIAARCCFNGWELEDRRHIVRDDLVRLHPRDRVMDLIQVASWTGPLANSMYCAEGRVNSITDDDINCFAYTHYKTDETSVASVGLPFEETITLAEMLEFKRERPAPRYLPLSCPRAGFELYDLGAKSDTWIALAVPGCGTCNDLDCLLKHAILAETLGTDDVARGQHRMDRTPMPPLPAMAGNDIFTQYRAFNISYRETGLFGILVRTRSCSAWQATLNASQFLTHVGDLTRQQIEIGRARLKLNLARHEEDCVRTSENLALQLSNNIVCDTARDAMCIIDAINVDEICYIAQMLSSKSCMMSMAVVGDVGAVPHDMELLRCR